MTPEMQAYFRAIAEVLAEQGWLQLSFLEIGGQAVASYFCFDYGRWARTATVTSWSTTPATTRRACPS